MQSAYLHFKPLAISHTTVFQSTSELVDSLNLYSYAFLILDVTVEIRLLHGQTLLADDRTIHEAHLIDGGKLHMVLEPAKDIKITFKLPMKGERQLTLSNSLRVHQMLQELANKKLLSGILKQQTVMLGDEQLEMNMPLHVYNIDRQDRKLTILPPSIGLSIIDEYNDSIYLNVNTKLDTILDLKRKIARTSKLSDTNFGMVMYQRFMKTQQTLLNTSTSPESYYPYEHAGLQWSQPHFHMSTKIYENPDQMRLYMKQGNGYNLLEDDCSIKDLGAENTDTLYLVYNDWGSNGLNIWSPYSDHAVKARGYPRFFRAKKLDLQSGTALGKGEEIKVVGRCCMGQTLLSVALKIQEQFDIPVESLVIYREIEEVDEQTMKFEKCELNEQINVEDCGSMCFVINHYQKSLSTQ